MDCYDCSAAISFFPLIPSFALFVLPLFLLCGVLFFWGMAFRSVVWVMDICECDGATTMVTKW